ncbi:MAG: DNA replication/repair protein RecF [Clostridia bacterium]|nr:DNA replication/repair protein RecF [Clostridia bacterium]
MIINNFYAEQFRNLKDVMIEPCSGVNMIYGENGQGKTNIIEGIWMFTGFKSFRTKRNIELIPHEEEFYNISMNFFGNNREQSFQIKSSKDVQEVYRNKVKVTSTRSIIGEFFSVVFSPSHLNLIKGGPNEKRKFLDIAISQINPSYARNLNDYYKILKHRNALLHNFEENNYSEDFLEIWDENLAKIGGKIITERKKYIEKLKVASINCYEGISEKKEKFNLEYVQSGKEEGNDEKENEDILLELLKESRYSDIKRKFTSKGPHRDDIEIKLNEKNIRNFGSQGQQRSASLALKLGEAYIINQLTDETPVALLDDVMSELDVGRQNYILNELKDWQVFITCCEPTQVMRMKSGKNFEIINGKYVSE